MILAREVVVESRWTNVDVVVVVVAVVVSQSCFLVMWNSFQFRGGRGRKLMVS